MKSLTRTRHSLRTTLALALAAASVGAIAAAAPAHAANPNTTKTENVSWTSQGVRYTGVSFASQRLGDSKQYSYGTLKIASNGNYFFSGHVYNGTVGADNMKTTCELVYPLGTSTRRLAIATANYSIGGHDHKDWNWNGVYVNTLQQDFATITSRGEVTCTLRVS